MNYIINLSRSYLSDKDDNIQSFKKKVYDIMNKE